MGGPGENSLKSPGLLVYGDMINIKEIAENIYQFEVPITGMYYTPTMYVVREAQSVLIEPGPPVVVPAILEAMNHLRIEDLSYIIPTHMHWDHAGGAGQLARAFPNARVLVHPDGFKDAIDPAGLIEGTKAIRGNDFEEHFGVIVPIPESHIMIPNDGETISINGRELQIIFAPGHAPHHFVIFDLMTQGLFCGESLGMAGYQLPGVTLDFDYDAYLETIEIIRHIGPKMLYYSHGDAESNINNVISRAAENARACGKIVLDALKSNEQRKVTERKIADYLLNVQGLVPDQLDLEHVVSGYTVYFEKQ